MRVNSFTNTSKLMFLPTHQMLGVNNKSKLSVLVTNETTLLHWLDFSQINEV